MVNYTYEFLVISVLYCKEDIISVNININNFTSNFKGYIILKLSPRSAFSLPQFIAIVGVNIRPRDSKPTCEQKYEFCMSA